MDPITTADPTSPATTSPAGATRAARAAAIKASADAPSEPAVENSTDGHDTSSSSTSSTADSGGEQQTVGDPREKAAAERMTRIQALRERERQAQERKRASQSNRVDAEELAQLRAMKAEWEKKDSAFADEEAFLAEAERRGISPEKVIGYVRDRMTNPEAIAERKANAAKTEIEKKLEALESQIRERDERDARGREEVEYQQKSLAAAKSFIDLSEARASDAPLVAAMYNKHGAEFVIAFANRFIIPILPGGFDVDVPEHVETLHDHMEAFLAETQLTGSLPANSEASTASNSKTVKTSGREPISTLSNRAVSERGTVTEEIPLAKLPLRERQRLLREKYERGEE